jgi:hypothetical protein
MSLLGTPYKQMQLLPKTLFFKDFPVICKCFILFPLVTQ